MTNNTPADFAAFMRYRVGPNWFIAKRTKRLVERHGDTVVSLSRARYDALKAEWEATKPNPKREALAYACTALDAARKLIEGMPAGYKPGERSGPNERETHAALVVALRLCREAGVEGF